jgi:hypothetical protein
MAAYHSTRLDLCVTGFTSDCHLPTVQSDPFLNLFFVDCTFTTKTGCAQALRMAHPGNEDNAKPVTNLHN